MDQEFKIYSLSPDDEIFDKAINSILSQLPTKNSTAKRLSAPQPNYTSVVLWLKYNIDSILLGGDLEEVDEYKGWSLIIKNLKRLNN